jgi:hypothetical protein
MLFAWVGGMGQADPPDDTLQHYLSKSHYALAAEVVSEPKKVDWPRTLSINKGQTAYDCQIKVTEWFHYPRPSAAKEFQVSVVVWGDSPPIALKKGQKCIFFLATRYGQVGPLATADPWFGVQPYNARMAELLKEQGKRGEPPPV